MFLQVFAVTPCGNVVEPPNVLRLASLVQTPAG